MDEIIQLAKAVMKLKTFQQRQEYLNESLDHLSFDYPEVYSTLLREIKRREIEINDPFKITKWLNESKSNSYVKLHEALLLVKNNNILAKEEYLENMKSMLFHTIETGTCIDLAMKICLLVEKSPSLKSIYE